MFISTHAYSAQVLGQRESETLPQFMQDLAQLRRLQAAWATSKITQRTAQLLQLAERIAAAKDELAAAVCMEVGRCLRECEARFWPITLPP